MVEPLPSSVKPSEEELVRLAHELKRAALTTLQLRTVEERDSEARLMTNAAQLIERLAAARLSVREGESDAWEAGVLVGLDKAAMHLEMIAANTTDTDRSDDLEYWAVGIRGGDADTYERKPDYPLPPRRLRTLPKAPA